MATLIHPWENSYPEGISWRAPLNIRSLDRYLSDAAEKWPAKPALIFGDESYTYSTLWSAVESAAKAFVGLGVSRGVNVGILFPNCSRHSIMCFGVLLAGGTVINLSSEGAPNALAEQLTLTDAQILVTSADALGNRNVGDVIRGSAVRTLVLFGLGASRPNSIGDVVTISQDAFWAQAADKLDGTAVDPDQIALLQFTGGTTGVPKAAIMLHRNVSAAIEITSSWLSPGFTEPDRRCILPLRMSHMYGMISLLTCIATGTPVFIQRTFDPIALIEDISREKITILFAVPTMFSAMLATGNLSFERLKSLKICIASGAPLTAKLEQAFQEATTISLRNNYGMTETITMCACQPAQGPIKREATGLPVPNALVEIVELEHGDTVLPQGQRGEVCVSGPQVVAGYWKQAEESAWAFRGGRYHTGDIGFIDSDGYLVVVDRKKDMIITAGLNVFPSRIEDTLRQHPAVLDAVVVGVSNAFMGELVKAFLRPPAGVAPCDIDDLIEFLEPRLSANEIPALFEWLDVFPQTKVGKIDRQALRSS